ncbi:MAG TPA: multiheme c-type cytochrome [Pirellulales bacterium]|jgi:predicted small lipoprotein YifL|nr:multiheme c-type cytochrome [Pirellulales bacterium]
MRTDRRRTNLLLILALGLAALALPGCSQNGPPSLPPAKDDAKTGERERRADKKPATAGDPVNLTLDKSQTPPGPAPATASEKAAGPTKLKPPADRITVSPPISAGNPLRTDSPGPEKTPTEKTPTEKTPAEKAPTEKTPTEDKTPAVQPGPSGLSDTLFKDWPTPQVALLLSGQQEGYLEPCGCAGFENMKGGLTRRDSFVKQMLAKKWPVVGLDAGGQLNLQRHGVEGQLQFDTTLKSFQKMGYQAVGLGPSDLLLPDSFILITNINDGELLVSANVVLDGVKPYRVIEQGGLKIGVTTVLGDSEQKALAKIQGGEAAIKIKPAAEALKAILPDLQAKKCNALILLAYAPPEEAAALAKQFPEFQYLVTANDANGSEPPAEASVIPGTKTHLIECGHKGSHVLVLGLYNDPKTPFRYQRVAMDKQFKESPDMIALKTDMQDQMKSLGWAGLELKPQPQPTGRAFVGTKTCSDCHSHAAEVFEKTPHAHAFATLENLTPERTHDPECVSCHVTGWNPQKFYPYVSGFVSKDKTPDLINNGCENCHGPGKAHATAENDEKATDAMRKKLRDELRLPMDKEKNRNACVECHDIDNSPKFQGDFDKYWEQIFHKGKD